MMHRLSVIIKFDSVDPKVDHRVWFERLVLPLNIHLRRETNGRVLGIKKVSKVDTNTLNVELLHSKS